MGRNNQQRRAAKARRRAKEARGRGAGPARQRGDGSGFTVFGIPRDQPLPPEMLASLTVADRVDHWLERALVDLGSGMTSRAEASCAELRALAVPAAGRRVVTKTLSARLTGAVTGVWQRGWRPAEVRRLVARHVGAGAAALVGDAMAAELGRYPVSTIAPDWLDQLAEVNASVWWSPDTTFVSARSLLSGDGLDGVISDVVGGIDALLSLPEIPLLDMLPGAWQPVRGAVNHVEERILERVRALLAKAESTPYEAEAETFTAGAQALMARHSIDVAMLAAKQPRKAGDIPAGRRVGIDRPYEAPKVLLLDAVAGANRCRTVWSKELAFVTVVGYPADLQAVDTLFTSLLVQATRAASAAGGRRRVSGQSRTRAFRTSFLTSFASRIGERLRQATDGETAAAQARPTSGQDLVLLLVERSAEVDAHVEQLFPDLILKPLAAVSDAEGWHAGRQAADSATLFGESMLAAQ